MEVESIRVKINDEIQDVLAVHMEDLIVQMLDQRWLPFKFQINHYTTWQETVQAITDLVTRGAGSVGVAGAFAFAQAAHAIKVSSIEEFLVQLKTVAQEIKQARPTAVTLGASVTYCIKAAEKGTTIKEKQTLIKQAAYEIQTLDIQASKTIGENGVKLLKDESRVLTHCNTGALAILDHGSALAVIRFAHKAGKISMVYVSETRPWEQGSRLTTWELQQEEIPHKLVIDSACGFLFSQNLVDSVIVGADRIAANGDLANKIGTYEKAVLAHEHKIPFYVAAPTFAFDLNCPNGSAIEIEERPATEVTTVIGRLPSGEIGPVQVAPDSTDALNPIFDITPAKYITGFITENGVLTKISTKNIKDLVTKTAFQS